MRLLTAKMQNLFAFFFLMAIFSATAFAEVPDAPQDLMVYPEYWEEDGAVNLFWMPSEGDDITYKIYRADGKTEDLSQFSQLDDDKYKIYDENDFGIYAIVEHGVRETYSYYVTASNSDGESDASNIVNIKLFSPNDFVEIISHPNNLNTKINEEWTYIVKAKSNQDGDINFTLDEAPEGAEIDEVTGKITWTPTEGGFYFFSIRAYLEDEEDLFTTQGFNVIVNECDVPAVISGQVIDENGKPIKIGMVTLYSRDDDNSIFYVNSYRFVNGEYEFEVDKGSYTFQVEGFADKDKIIYEPKFYENASNLEDADWFTINCEESLSADFALKSYNWEKEQIFIISQPPRAAVIGEELTYQVEIEYDGESEIIYELQNAPDGATISETGLLSWTAEKYGYYYFGLMVRTDNQMSHDFQHFMIKVLSCDNPATISGVVTDEDGEPIVHGNVFLINVSELDDSLHIDEPWVGSTEIIDGEYTFDAVDEGEYILYFEGYGYTNEIGYVPEYYNDAKDYEDAEILTINCEDALTFNAELKKMPNWETYIRFTSEPVRIARIDEEYIYDADAETNYEDGVITYKFEYSPEGAEIDAETGVITWTPTEGGMHEFAVIAYIEEFGGMFADYQHFQVVITECENLASISGTIKDEDGDIIENAYVVLINGNLTEDGDSINYINYAYSEDGYYEFNDLDKGTYYLYSEGFGRENKDDFYYGEWYENKYNWMDADAIVLECGDAVTVDFELEKFVEPNIYWVSGTVIDEQTGEDLPWISVEFIGTDEKNGFTERFVVWTNQKGNYEIKLNDNLTYIARAAGMNIGIKGDTNALNSYWPEYYNNVSDPSEAQIIELTGNMDDVNFTLDRIPDFENSLSGSIIDKNEIAISPAVVVAYLIDAEDDAFDDMAYFGRAMEVDDDGAFLLENLIPGEYVMMAHPKDRMYVPGYYKEDGFAVRSWEDATVVTVEESGNSGEYAIMLELHQKVAGKGKVRGAVGRKGKTAKVTDEVAADDALVGAMIYVQNSEGKFVNTVQTDEMGQFNVAGLPNGEYSLKADKIGYFTGSTNFVIHDEEEVEVNFDLDTKTTSVEDNFSAENANVFPNPATENFTVEFNSLTSGSITITVSNLLGNVVHEQKANASAGINQFSVDFGNQSSGAYFVKISDERGTLAITPVIIK